VLGLDYLLAYEVGTKVLLMVMFICIKMQQVYRFMFT